MKERLVECYRVLKPTGSIYLHCDWHASHHLKVEMDKIFLESNFRNEIIWKRTSAHTGEGRVTKFGTVHDSILFYTKSNDYVFNPQYTSYDEKYTDKFYANVEPDGRRWTSSDLMAAGVRKGESGKVWRGIDPNTRGNHWKFTVTKLDELDKEGRIYWPKKAGGVPRYKRYLDEMKGLLLQDVWTDINPLQAHSRERQGYPTQKPELLLERIINASSNPAQIVLDPFCGCGTAIVVAHKLGRKWVGIDVSPTACNLMEKRMRSLGAENTVMGMPMTEDDLRKISPTEFQNWVIRRLFGRVSTRIVGDMGIDGYTFEGYPVQVKQSDDIGRNVIDNFQTAMRRYKAKKGIIVAFSFGKGAYEEVARAKLHEGLEIDAVTVADLLKNGREKSP
jgi:DNA modification methylase